jgi:predicted metal-dependent peptidase
METVNKDNNSIYKSVEKCSMSLAATEPFYTHFLCGMLKKINNVGTACVSKYKDGVLLQIDPDFWCDKLTTNDQRKEVLKHEILHIVFQHIFRCKDFSNVEIRNVAADVVVNQYINLKVLEDDYVSIDKFTDIYLEHNKSIDYYYDKLKRLHDEFYPLEKPKIKEMMDKIMNDIKNGKTPNQHDISSIYQDDPDLSNKDGYKSWQELKKFIMHKNLSHEFWREFDSLNECEKQMLREKIENNIINGSKLSGKNPAFIEEIINDILDSRKAVVNWQKILRNIVASSLSSKIKNTIHRKSKRYGTSPGIKIKRSQRILVGIDTSGSISKNDLEDFFVEIHNMYKIGHTIEVVEADTTITNKYLYKGECPESVTGRGGTDFNEVIDYANESKPDLLIYFTDGYGSCPNNTTNCKTIWVISTNGVSEPIKNFDGAFIFLKN